MQLYRKRRMILINSGDKGVCLLDFQHIIEITRSGVLPCSFKTVFKECSLVVWIKWCITIFLLQSVLVNPGASILLWGLIEGILKSPIIRTLSVGRKFCWRLAEDDPHFQSSRIQFVLLIYHDKFINFKIRKMYPIPKLMLNLENEIKNCARFVANVIGSFRI